MVKIPSEYKKGFTEFLGCRIDLRNRVFIPRIETEYWVGKAIEDIQKLKIESRGLKVLDIFSGSGCIGVAVLKNIKNSQVDFLDIDEKSVSQIKINLKLNGISEKRYNVFKSDFFEKVRNNKYNVIFTNPPYVAKERINEVGKSVLKYEPKQALFSGKKGLNHIKRFLKDAKKFLKKEGIIYLEFDPLQKKEIEEILTGEKYEKFKFLKDQFKEYRWVQIIKIDKMR